jgi:hypothetical protein
MGGGLRGFLAGSSPAEPPPPPVITPSSGKYLSCCWCQISKENYVSPYSGFKNCESRSSPQYSRRCRQIDVLSDTCSLLKVRHGSGGLEWEPAPLKYVDNGQVKEILPPELGVTVQLGASGAGGGPMPSNYCSCERDPASAHHCQITRFNNGQTDVLARAQMLADQPDCSYNQCLRLWSVEEFAGRCPAYVQGTP